MAPKEKAEAQTFTFDEVACIIAAMNTAGVALGAKHYGLMAKLDGTRTTSSFEHKFRAVKARGKHLATDLNDGTATPKTADKTKTPASKKRGKKAVEADDDDDEVPRTPSKKAKTKKVKKEPSEEVSDNAADGFGINGNHFENALGPE